MLCHWLTSWVVYAQPNKMFNSVTLKRDFRRVAKTIVKETSENFYRPDLQKGEHRLVLAFQTPGAERPPTAAENRRLFRVFSCHPTSKPVVELQQDGDQTPIGGDEMVGGHPGVPCAGWMDQRIVSERRDLSRLFSLLLDNTEIFLRVEGSREERVVRCCLGV